MTYWTGSKVTDALNKAILVKLVLLTNIYLYKLQFVRIVCLKFFASDSIINDE